MHFKLYFRANGRKQVFPLVGADEEDSNDVMQIGKQESNRDNPNQYRIYDMNGCGACLSTMGGGGLEPHTAIPIKTIGNYSASNHNASNIVEQSGIAPIVMGNHGTVTATAIPMFGIDYNKGGQERQIANTISTRNTVNGVSNVKQDGTAIAITMGYDRGLKEITTGTFPTCNARDYKGVNFRDLGGVAIPVLTPDRAKKSQNGRRMKDNGDEAFTLTSQDIHGVALKIKEATSKGYAEAQEGDSINLSVPESKTRRGRVGKGVANTLDTSCEQGVPVVWYDKYNCYIAIRKLTPKECWRLQSFSDDEFDKAQFVNSDSQLYKQAGNSVTVNVVYDIAKAIGETYENKRDT